MVSSLQFGAQYNLVGPRGFDSRFTPKVSDSKTAALVKALSESGQDVLVISSGKAKLVEAGIPEEKIIEKEKAGYHSETGDTAEVLTAQDAATFKAEFPIFKKAGLDVAYLFMVRANPNAKTILCGDKEA